MDALSKFLPLGYAQAASIDAAQNLPGVGSPAAIPKGAYTIAVLVPEGQAIRFRDDGTDPTAAVGAPVAVGQEYIYSGNLSTIRVISQVAGAKLNVSYYARKG